MIGSARSAIKILQLALRTRIPRQSETRGDYQVVPSHLHSLMILVTPILTTNGTSVLPAFPLTRSDRS